MHVCVLTLYIILAFFVYNEGSSKTHQSSLTLKGGSTAFSGSPDKSGGKIFNFPEKVIPLCHE